MPKGECNYLVDIQTGERCNRAQFADEHDPLGYRYGDARYEDCHPYDRCPLDETDAGFTTKERYAKSL